MSESGTPNPFFRTLKTLHFDVLRPGKAHCFIVDERGVPLSSCQRGRPVKMPHEQRPWGHAAFCPPGPPLPARPPHVRSAPAAAPRLRACARRGLAAVRPLAEVVALWRARVLAYYLLMQGLIDTRNECTEQTRTAQRERALTSSCMHTRTQSSSSWARA